MTPRLIVLQYPTSLEPRELVVLAGRLTRGLRALAAQCGDLTQPQVFVLIGSVTAGAHVLADSPALAATKLANAVTEAAAGSLGPPKVLDSWPRPTPVT